MTFLAHCPYCYTRVKTMDWGSRPAPPDDSTEREKRVTLQPCGHEFRRRDIDDFLGTEQPFRRLGDRVVNPAHGEKREAIES